MTEDKTSRRKSIVTLAMIFAVLFGYVFTSSYLRTGGGCTSGPGMGTPSPPFTVAMLNGSQISSDQYKGKVLLLNFWASWCPPCRKELPTLQSLYKKHKDHPDFAFLAVSCDENKEDVFKLLQSHNVELPVALDPQREVAFLKYGVQKFPETFFIDKTGMIRQKFIGPRDWTDPDIQNALEKLLAEKPGS